MKGPRNAVTTNLKRNGINRKKQQPTIHVQKKTDIKIYRKLEAKTEHFLEIDIYAETEKKQYMLKSPVHRHTHSHVSRQVTKTQCFFFALETFIYSLLYFISVAAAAAVAFLCCVFTYLNETIKPIRSLFVPYQNVSSFVVVVFFRSLSCRCVGLTDEL